jgi:hypothetical protein
VLSDFLSGEGVFIDEPPDRKPQIATNSYNHLPPPIIKKPPFWVGRFDPRIYFLLHLNFKPPNP